MGEGSVRRGKRCQIAFRSAAVIYARLKNASKKRFEGGSADINGRPRILQVRRGVVPAVVPVEDGAVRATHVPELCRGGPVAEKQAGPGGHPVRLPLSEVSLLLSRSASISSCSIVFMFTRWFRPNASIKTCAALRMFWVADQCEQNERRRFGESSVTLCRCGSLGLKHVQYIGPR